MTGAAVATSAARSPRLAVRLLIAQAVAFGIAAALLGIVANAMFLEAYGSEWLPVTYLAIGAAGIVVSGLVARSARSGDLLRIATVVLGGSVVLLVAAWAVSAGGDAAWVSGPLLVLFPVLIQLGFVFIGGQAGRVLDIAGIKAHFPRIVAGFPAGAVVGGVLAGPLIDLSGRAEHLLLATAVALSAFLGLLRVTGRRYATALAPAARAAPDRSGTGPDDPVRPPLSQLLRGPFVLMIVAYQVLSAVGSQLADFLVFDRAAARYPDGEDLARFVARYTAVMNVTSILFLVLLAGVLLRRHGLRLGLPANPAVLAVIAFVMVAIGGAAGVGSFALLIAASAARIADIALTDGTTRTSINATFQVLPPDEQLAVQASVEGVGVPVAIAASGVVILVLDLLPFAVEAMVVALAVTCVVWTWVAVRLYHGYRSALVAELTRRPVLDEIWPDDGQDEDEAAARSLVASTELRDVQLGLDLLEAMASPALGAELEALVADPRPEIRHAAQVRLAGSGDPTARAALRTEALEAAASPDPDARVRAAHALGELDTGDRATTQHLLVDPDPSVRAAAIASVRAGDEHAVAALIDALGDPRTRASATAALERLGPCVAPAAAAALAAAGCPAPPDAERLVRVVKVAAPEVAPAVLGGHVGHPDRQLGEAVLAAVVAPGPASSGLAAALDRVLLDDARHAARVGAALVACAPVAAPGTVLHRALTDELLLLRARVAAGRLARHGTVRLGSAILALGSDERRRSLAVETLEVTLERAEAALALPVLRADLAAADLVAQLPAPPGPQPADAPGWLAELIADADDTWRSPWLRACALHTALGLGLDLPVTAGQLRELADPVIDELLPL